MTRDCFEKRRHAELILILSVIAYFLLMWGNGIVSLTHPDEVFYVQSAKEMVSHNSWMTPLIFDQPQFEKPILFFWLLALGIKFFGLTPFIARFWPALTGKLSVIKLMA
jgi:4-amino-4-deoxy-L-arabinose transferase-like glycosyltransferase